MSVTITPSVIPHLTCRNAADAITFYEKAFGAKEEIRLAAPDGRLMHACITINGSPVMLVDEMPEHGSFSPQHYQGTPVTLHLIVADADAAAQQAVDAGAEVVMEVADQFWGDRYGIVRDPFGHEWSIAQPGRTLTAQEDLEKAMADVMPGA